MNKTPSPEQPSRGNPVVRQLDKLRRAGRVTEDEARALETAGDDQAFNTALLGIRARHAGTRLDAAVEDGSISRAEADDLLRRVKGGEHTRGLRSHISKLRPGTSTKPLGSSSDQIQ
jgi:hypothetical protein